MKSKLLITLLLLTAGAKAQQKLQPFFKNGDKVCFVGNSITNNGDFYNFIYLYYATRFPDEKLRFVNCGISGDVASGILKRLDKDVFIHNPTHTVLMVGMNDVRRDLYAPQVSGKPNIAAERQKALDVYRRDAEEIVKRLSASSKVILEKPTIYDENTVAKTVSNRGVNGALGQCAEMVGNLSAKYKTGLIDYYSLMNQVNDKLHQADSSATIIGADRVHPNAPGHLLMAYQFLKSVNSPKYVAKMVIGKNVGQSNQNSLNCEIKDYQSNDNEIAFICKEWSLPFVVKPDAVEALKWIPLTDDLNQEILQVQGIEPGDYDLRIDGRPIATYTAAQLKDGVNLAVQTNTPQYKQAARIQQLCAEYRRQESAIRNIKFVEVGRLAAGRQVTDTASVKKYLSQYLDSVKTGGHYDFYKTQFTNYLANKPREAAINQQMDEIAEKIYTINKPVFHKFQLIKK